MDKLSPSQIFSKTLKFVILRMAVPLVTAIISLITLKIITGIVTKGDADSKMGIISTLIWLIITAAVFFAINFFVGYRFRAGQMAVITDAVSVNMIPEDMGALAKESVDYRFPSGIEYLTYKMSVMRSIQQLQMQLNTFAENRLKVPVLGQLIRFCQFVIGHSLSFTYDLILCYTFWRDGKTLYTSAADGIAVYWDSWKRIFQNVLLLAIYIIVGMTLGFSMIFVLVAASCAPASGSFAGALAGIVVGYLVCMAAKVVLDTNLTVRTLDAFFEEAQYADYNAEEYENMCKYSKVYDKLYRKACNEAFAPAPQTAPNPNQGDYIG